MDKAGEYGLYRKGFNVPYIHQFQVKTNCDMEKYNMAVRVETHPWSSKALLHPRQPLAPAGLYQAEEAS